MQITRQADYAVRAVLHLARLGPRQRAATAQIAQEAQIPPTFLAKIVSQLGAAGLLRATRGAHGGVALARPADEISLLQVVEAIDGPLTLNACALDPGRCALAATCEVQAVWSDARQALVQRLGQVSFAQLVGNGKQGTAAVRA